MGAERREKWKIYVFFENYKISCGNTVRFKAFLREIVCTKRGVKLISRIYISFFGRSNVALLYVGLAGWLTDVSRGGFCYHRGSGKWDVGNGMDCTAAAAASRQDRSTYEAQLIILPRHGRVENWEDREHCTNILRRWKVHTVRVFGYLRPGWFSSKDFFGGEGYF